MAIESPLLLAEPDWSPCRQVARIIRRSGGAYHDVADMLLSAADLLERDCCEAGGQVHFRGACPGEVVLACAAGFWEVEHSHVQRAPLPQFVVWGREGMDEMQGSAARKCWLKRDVMAARRGSGQAMAAHQLSDQIADAAAGGPALADLVADVAYAVARRRLLPRLEAMAADGKTPAVLLGVRGSWKDRMDFPASAGLLVLSLPPPLPGASLAPIVARAAAQGRPAEGRA